MKVTESPRGLSVTKERLSNYKADYSAALTFLATEEGTQLSQMLELERKFLAVSSISPPDSSM